MKIMRMWYRNTKLVNAVGRMALIEMPDTGLPHSFKLKNAVLTTIN